MILSSRTRSGIRLLVRKDTLVAHDARVRRAAGEIRQRVESRQAELCHAEMLCTRYVLEILPTRRDVV